MNLKKYIMKKALIVTIIIIITSLLACSKDDLTVLSQQEKDDLSFLREEEKLARDVYLFSYNKYGDEIFNNISQSEQNHMNSVLTLLKKYKVNDPAQSAIGVFSNETLQDLYNDLTAQSDSSLIEALKVGALIEDLDIKDIDLNILNTKNTDLMSMYLRLRCGSTNHMRAFTKQIDGNGSSYTPQFISSDIFFSIINSENQKCSKN